MVLGSRFTNEGKMESDTGGGAGAASAGKPGTVLDRGGRREAAGSAQKLSFNFTGRSEFRPSPVVTSTWALNEKAISQTQLLPTAARNSMDLEVRLFCQLLFLWPNSGPFLNLTFILFLLRPKLLNSVNRGTQLLDNKPELLLSSYLPLSVVFVLI